MKKKPAKKKALSPAKFALIGVLVLVLCVVWGGALSGGAPKKVAKNKKRPTPNMPAHPTNDHQAAAAMANRDTPIADWPVMPLRHAVRNDPFARPTWALTPEPEKKAGGAAQPGAANIARLRQTGASMIVIAGDSKIATVGEHEVRIGDHIEGYEVIDITPKGVVFADPTPPGAARAPRP